MASRGNLVTFRGDCNVDWVRNVGFWVVGNSGNVALDNVG